MKSQSKSQKKGLGLKAQILAMTAFNNIDNPPIFEQQEEFNPDPAIKDILQPMNFEFNILRHPSVMHSPGLPIVKIVFK